MGSATDTHVERLPPQREVVDTPTRHAGSTSYFSWDLKVPTFEGVAAALDSIEIPVNHSREKVKTSEYQINNGMCLGVVWTSC